MQIRKLVLADGEVERTLRPHPAVVLDFDKEGKLLAVSAPAIRIEDFDD